MNVTGAGIIGQCNCVGYGRIINQIVDEYQDPMYEMPLDKILHCLFVSPMSDC